MLLFLIYAVSSEQCRWPSSKGRAWLQREQGGERVGELEGRLAGRQWGATGRARGGRGGVMVVPPELAIQGEGHQR